MSRVKKEVKTFVFDMDGNYLLARNNREWAVKSAVKVSNNFALFTYGEVKRDKHKKFFKELKKRCNFKID